MQAHPGDSVPAYRADSFISSLRRRRTLLSLPTHPKRRGQRIGEAAGSYRSLDPQ